MTNERGFTLIEILVSMTILAALASAALILVPVAQERSRRAVCAQNLRDLGGAYQLWQMESPGAAPHPGSAVFLEWRKERRMIRFGEEDKLLCPGDPSALYPQTDSDRARWDDVDLASPDPSLCSYAARDTRRHPIGGGVRRIIACDRQGADGRTPHHDGGLNVLYDDGAVVFVTRRQLGLDDPDAPLRVGPESEVAVLREVLDSAR
jgi:prepilin-type N-terminal cleavage/methylation domain-containing protein